jgi:hypothetical protein
MLIFLDIFMDRIGETAQVYETKETPNKSCGIRRFIK